MIDDLIRTGLPCLFAFAGALALASLHADLAELWAIFKETNDAE